MRRDLPLVISDEVSRALNAGHPVVAFETTILSFGLPFPLNRQVAQECESVVREAGAVPATIGIMDGMIRVGLQEDKIQRFCTERDTITKVNLQNFAAVLAGGKLGALTVAGTMHACWLAGIRVFATGGIGGVHRGFSESLDISSDLTALGRYPVAVVCAGAKSILDTAATLEALETLGVPIIGVGTNTFPQFYCRDSGFALENHCERMKDAARQIALHWGVGGKGILVVVPAPVGEALEHGIVDKWIETAMQDARSAGISGKEVTPFLLARLEALSDGATLRANRALIANNAAVATEIAGELSRFRV